MTDPAQAPQDRRRPLREIIPVPLARRLEIIILCVLVAGYCTVQLHNLLLPGLYCDEALDATRTQEIIRAGIRQMQHWPLNIHYHGALQSYLLLPFFLAIKRPEVALRVGEVCFSLIVIALTYLCARQLFNRIVALFTLLFLLTNPCFVYMSRISVPHGGIMAAFYLGALLCLRAWSRTERDRYLFSASFLLGAGICIRLWFYWFLAGLILALPLFQRDAFRLLKRPPMVKRLVIAAFSLALGLGLFIGKEIVFWGTDSGTIHYLAHGFDGGGVSNPSGASNFALLHNLANNLRQIAAAMAGHMLDIFPTYPGALKWLLQNGMEVAYGSLLILCILCVLCLAKDAVLRNGRLFICVLAGMLFCSLFTTSNGYRQEHLYILFPLPQIMMGLASYLLLQRFLTGKTFRKTALLGLFCFGLSPVFHLWELSRLEEFVRSTGGTGYHSDASKSLSDWLVQRGHHHPKACDWGVHDVLRLLSKGDIEPQCCYHWSDELGTRARKESLYRCLYSSISNGDPLIFVENGHARSNRSYFSAFVREQGNRLVEEEVFLTRNGEKAYSVYSMR